jgi:hypothetical protein
MAPGRVHRCHCRGEFAKGRPRVRVLGLTAIHPRANRDGNNRGGTANGTTQGRRMEAPRRIKRTKEGIRVHQGEATQ